jgi:hypothetical protein
MTTVDFTDFGFANVALPLETEVADRSIGAGPLVILLAENHLDFLGIARALRTAVRLVDARVVDFVGVEGSVDGVAADLLRRLMARGEALADYSRDALARYNGYDGLIAELASRPGFEFARTLRVLFPHMSITSVEDPALASEAAKAHDQLMAPHAAGGSAQRDAIAREFRSLEVNRRRERAFAENLLAGRKAAGATRAALLNAGGYHQKMLFPEFVKRGLSVLHLRPDGYTDALT